MRYAFAILLALLTTLAAAQTTTVTLQVTDADAQTWNNGTYQATYFAPPNIPNASLPATRFASGTLSATGGATFALASNAPVLGSTWQFAVCPQATSDCFRQTFLIQGASQNVTINPPAIRINGTTMTPTTLAYSDNEIVNQPVGAQYYNVTALTQKQWNGTVWSSVGGGGAPPFNTVTAGSNTATLTTGPGGSLGPVSSAFHTPFGQLSANALYIPLANGQYIPAMPTLTSNTTGGTIVTGVTEWVMIKFVGPPAAQNQPSVENNVVTTGCTGGNQCSITVTMPSQCTSPVAPVTGCTVYHRNARQGETASTETGCVNSTAATCTLTVTNGAGSAITFPSESGVLPPNFVSEAPYLDNCQPFIFQQLGDLTWHPYGCVDMGFVNFVPRPFGVPTLRDKLHINDGLAENFANSLVVIAHDNNGGTTAQTGQDRALAIASYNPTGDSSVHYGIEGLQVESDWTGTATLNGSPDGELAAISGQIGDFNTAAGWNSGTLGPHVIRAEYFREVGAGYPSNGPQAIQAIFANQSSVSAAGTQAHVIDVSCQDTAGPNSLSCANISINSPTGLRFSNNWGMILQGNGPPTPTLGADFGIKANWNSNNIFNVLQSPLALGGTPALAQNGAASMKVVGSLNVGGGVTTNQASAPSAPTIGHNGTSGATTNTYAVCFVDVNGGTICSPTINDTTANANLTSTNSTNVNFKPYEQRTTFIPDHYDVYRTVTNSQCNGVACSPATGKIGTFTLQADISTAVLSSVQTFVDTGLVGDGATLPTGNTTAGETITGLLQAPSNIARVCSAGGTGCGGTPGDFTSANSGALQAITGLTISLGNTAKTMSFHCVVMSSQATNVAGDQYGVAVLNTAPTSVDVYGQMATNTGAATPISTGVLNGLNTTTPTAVVTFQPGGTGVFGGTLDGTIQTAGLGTATFQLYILNGTAADVQVVKRGSYCKVY